MREAIKKIEKVMTAEMIKNNVDADEIYYCNDFEKTVRTVEKLDRLCPFCAFYDNERLAAVAYVYCDGSVVIFTYNRKGYKKSEFESSFFDSEEVEELIAFFESIEAKGIAFRTIEELYLYASAFDVQRNMERRKLLDKKIEKFLSENDYPDKKPGHTRAYYRGVRKKAIKKKVNIVKNVYCDCVPYANNPNNRIAYYKYAGQYNKGKIHDSRKRVRGRKVISPNETKKYDRDKAAYEDYLDNEWLFPINM